MIAYIYAMKSLPFKILISTITTLALGIASGFSTIQSITDWYQYLNKPSFNPPNWIFGPVWTILYLMMGIAFAMIWHSRHPQKNKAMLLFAIQFIFNLAWSFLFFNRHLLGIAFIEILLMGCFIALTINSFYKINKLAAYLLIPYLCWVSFAAVLNGAIWFLNK